MCKQPTNAFLGRPQIVKFQTVRVKLNFDFGIDNYQYGVVLVEKAC